MNAMDVAEDTLVGGHVVGDRGDVEALGKYAQSSEDEDDGLEEELDFLVADGAYHEFIDHIVTNKEVSEDIKDYDFHPEVRVCPDEDNVNEAAKNEDILADSSSDSSSDVEDDSEETPPQKVDIPVEALREARQRFPPFWRVKQAFTNLETASYQSTEDPDYQLPAVVEGFEGANAEQLREKVDLDDSGDTDSDSSSADEEEEDECMQGEVDVLAKDIESPIDVNELVEMVEDLTLPPSAGAETVKEEEEEGDGMEQEKAALSIAEFDHQGYESDQDPDYVPTEQELADDEEGVSSSGSSSSASEEEDD